MARKLAKAFDNEDKGAVGMAKNGEAKSPGAVKQETIEDDDDDVVALDSSNIAGPSSAGPSSSSKAVHPMFAKRKMNESLSATSKREDLLREIKPSVDDASTTQITPASADAVEPIDFDVEAFSFDPTSIDVSNWPKGRLPYSVLVGVYVQVSSTRSRLTITRVLTK